MPLFRPIVTACAAAALLTGSVALANPDSDLLGAAKQGNVAAQIRLGTQYLQGKQRNQDFDEAALWFKKAALTGNAEAQYQYARLCLVGRGVSQSYYEAAAWFKKAAEQNHAKAQVNLAYLYESGHGIGKNLDSAQAWYAKACENGNDLGCTKWRKHQR